MKKLKRLLLFFVCGLVACAMAIPLAACTGGTGGGEGGTPEQSKDKSNWVLQSLNVDSFDAKRNFGIGEEFSYDGLAVTANYQVLGDVITADNEDVTDKVEFDLSEFDNSKAGTYTIYLSYTFKTVTLYGDYEVTVNSGIEGTIAGLEVEYSGDRQINLSAEAPTASIDLTKIKVTRMTGDNVDDVGETILPSSYYKLYYGKDGGELTAVAADATTISGLTKGIYTVYAFATHERGTETFEMSGFVTVYVVDTPVALTKDEGGTLTYDYGTDVNTIGSDWKFTVKYASGATAALTAEDVDFGDRVSDKEGENVVTVSHTEEILGYDSKINDAVSDSVTVECEVTYTIGENPNAGKEETKTYSVNFSLTEWSDPAYASGGSGMPFGTPLPIGTDGKPGTSGGIISVWGKADNSNCYIREANSSGTAAGYSNEFYLGAIELSSGTVRRALSIDLTDYDSAEITVVWRADKDRGISLFTDEAAATAADSAALRENGYMDSENATDPSQMLTTKFENIAGGDIYYFGGNNNTVYIYEIIVEATKEGSSVVAGNVTFNVDDLVAGTSYTTNTVIASSGKTAIEVMAYEGAKNNVSVEDRSSSPKTFNGITFNSRLKLNGTGTDKNCSLKITTEGAATITVYAVTGSSSSERTLVLYDIDFAVLDNTQTTVGDDIKEFTYEVSGAGEYFIASANSGINIYYIAIEYAG